MFRKTTIVAAIACAPLLGLAATSVPSASASTASRLPTTLSAAAPSFGAANTRLCATKTAAPNYPDAIPKLSGASTSLSGAGSTFAAPMIDVWTKVYSQKEKVQVAYSSVGSGAGVQQVQANTVNFGQSDTGMDASDLAKAKGPVLQIPVLLGADVPAYNLSGIKSGLKFTGDVLGQIYAGIITKWNAPAIAKLNPGVKLPDESIAVVHRSDGSGTTGIWTNYLTKTSPQWVKKLGGPTLSQGKTVAWPVGLGGKGNEGVAGLVAQTSGSIGYIELQYALASKITYGQVKNSSGRYIQPCIASVIPSVDGIKFPANLNTSLTDGSAPNVYPIAGTSYALIYKNQTSKAKAAALVNFFSWVLGPGQNYNAGTDYAPLGKALDRLAVNKLKTITVNGTRLVKA